MKSYLLFTARIMGLYAAILAFVHGVFEIQQGKGMVEGISINAIGNGCVANQIWHACFPAITIWPSYLPAGLITMILSAALFLFVLLYLHRENVGWIILVFAVANLLSGGGFIPALTAIMAVVAAFINGKQKSISGNNRKPYIILWSVLLIAYLFYAAGGWLLGNYFNTFMIENSFPLFITMDLLTPILCIIFAGLADTHIPSQLA